MGDVEEEALGLDRFAALVLDHHHLVLDPDGPSVSGDEPILTRERASSRVPARVLLAHAVEVVRMDEAPEEVRSLEPLARRVAEEVFDLRTDVCGEARLVDRAHVCDEGELLDERSVAGLGVTQARDGLAALVQRPLELLCLLCKPAVSLLECPRDLVEDREERCVEDEECEPQSDRDRLEGCRNLRLDRRVVVVELEYAIRPGLPLEA